MDMPDPGCDYDDATILRRIRALVAKQAKNEALWFEAETASEAYLQQELRKLHALIEENQ